jgi:NADH-quinone oxidoreductase subunit F
VATVVGDVVDPTVVEVEMGTPLDVLIEHGAGGPRPGRTIKAVFSGVANAVIVAEKLGTRLTYEHMAAIGSGLGSAGFIVYDDTACMVEVGRLMSSFLAVESCGQCPPCKLGSTEITERLFRIEGGAGVDDDIATIGSWLRQVTDSARCYLATEEQEVVSSLLRCFPEEFAAHLDNAACPLPRDLPFPPTLNLGGGRRRSG